MPECIVMLLVSAMLFLIANILSMNSRWDDSTPVADLFGAAFLATFVIDIYLFIKFFSSFI